MQARLWLLEIADLTLAFHPGTIQKKHTDSENIEYNTKDEK